MSAHDTLSQIVDLEAGKLLKRAQVGDVSLSDDDLAALETLSRCAKALKPEEKQHKDTTEGLSPADLLELTK